MMPRKFPKPPCPPDADVLWVEVDDKDLHFLDAVLMVTDGLANVRREYKVLSGKKMYKVFAAPGHAGEVEKLIRSAGRFVPIGQVLKKGQ